MDMAAAVMLPDDLVRLILVRVADPAALFRCAMTCKRWRILLAADPSFLRRIWPEDGPNSSTLAGFFALQTDGVKPVFVPVPRSPISASRRLLSSFCQAAGFMADNVVPLTSRRGLLLVRIHQRVCGEPNQLAVCNILAGTFEMLPPLKHNVDFNITGYTILTSTDCISRRGQHSPLSPGYYSFFRVLVIGLNNHGTRNQYFLLMYSSNESSWTAPQECPNNDNISHVYKRGSAVVCRGTAHWLFQCASGYCTLDVSADTGHLSLTKLQINRGHFRSFRSTGAPQLSIAIDGKLSLLNLHPDDGSQINIWTRQETESGDGTSTWIRTGIIELKRSKHRLNGTFSISVGERSCTLLFIDPSDAFVHVGNLQTGTAETVHELFQGLLYDPTLPLMVDWPSFFMSRLGDSGKGCISLATRLDRN